MRYYLIYMGTLFQMILAIEVDLLEISECFKLNDNDS